MMLILVTGGAGFIGSHLTDLLISEGHQVRILDSLSSQVHGEGAAVPEYLNTRSEFILGDVCNRQMVREALSGVDVVFHLAAETGVGQSMYQIHRYAQANIAATALLMDVVINEAKHVRKVIVASSRAVYGEGSYYCEKCGPTASPTKVSGSWDAVCSRCGSTLMHKPTPEVRTLEPASIYAISKQATEEIALCVGQTYRLPVVALRFFNVYGPRQSLRNPYTGILSVFSVRCTSDQTLEVYEDGKQTRDFVHVYDVARACVLAMERTECNYEVINIGTGQPTSILTVARELRNHLGSKSEITLIGRGRAGDIRHCYADVRKAQALLGFTAAMSLRDGLAGFARWVQGQEVEDRYEYAKRELEQRKLILR